MFNPLDSKRIYSATSNNMKLVHWPLMGGLFIWYSEEGLCGLRPCPVPSYLYLNVCAVVYQSLYCYMMVRCSAVLIIIIRDLYSAFRSEDTEALDAAQED